MHASHTFLSQDIILAIEATLVVKESLICNWDDYRGDDAFICVSGHIRQFLPLSESPAVENHSLNWELYAPVVLSPEYVLIHMLKMRKREFLSSWTVVD